MSRLRGLFHDSSGSSLVEVLVYVGLLTSFIGGMSVALFQAFGTRAAIEDGGLAVNELRRGLSWFAEDVPMAREASITVDEYDAQVLNLQWRSYFAGGTTTTDVTYAVADGLLLRTHSINSGPESGQAVARGVVAATFTIDQELRSITAELEVNAARGSTDSLSMKAVMRPEMP